MIKQEIKQTITCDKCGQAMSTPGIAQSDEHSLVTRVLRRLGLSSKFYVALYVIVDGSSQVDLCKMCAALIIKEYAEEFMAYSVEVHQ